MWHLVCSMHTSHWWLICLTLDSWMQKEIRECSNAQKLASWFLDFCRVSYWQARYGGYSGDLKPTSALDLLKKDGNVVLVDIRPQASLLASYCICMLLLFTHFGNSIQWRQTWYFQRATCLLHSHNPFSIVAHSGFGPSGCLVLCILLLPLRPAVLFLSLRSYSMNQFFLYKVRLSDWDDQRELVCAIGVGGKRKPRSTRSAQRS